MEERIVVVDLGRIQLDQGHQLALATVTVELADAKTDVDAAREAMKEERLSSSQRDSCCMEQVRSLEVRLENEEKRLEERNAVAESERIELEEEHRLLLAGVTAEVVEANTDLIATQEALR